nr:hypothetical protein [Nanoarchaeum sp.]
MKAANFLFWFGLTVLAAGGMYHENRFNVIRHTPDFVTYTDMSNQLEKLESIKRTVEQVPYFDCNIGENLDLKIEEIGYEIKDLEQYKNVVLSKYYYKDGLPVLTAGLLLLGASGLVRKLDS